MRKLIVGLFALALVALAAPAEGAVGAPIPADIPENFERSWCPQKCPPKTKDCNDFEPPAEAIEAGWSWKDQCPSNGWRGYYAEFFPHTETALRKCWEKNLWGTKVAFDGNRTRREFDYAQVFWNRASREYRECWYSEQSGGSRANPIVIDESTLRYYPSMPRFAKSRGAWPDPGEVGSFTGFDPIYPFTMGITDAKLTPDGVNPIWPVYVRNALPAEHPINAPGAATDPDDGEDGDSEPESELQRFLDALRDLIHEYEPEPPSTGKSGLQVR